MAKKKDAENTKGGAAFIGAAVQLQRQERTLSSPFVDSWITGGFCIEYEALSPTANSLPNDHADSRRLLFFSQISPSNVPSMAPSLFLARVFYPLLLVFISISTSIRNAQAQQQTAASCPVVFDLWVFDPPSPTAEVDTSNPVATDTIIADGTCRQSVGSSSRNDDLFPGYYRAICQGTTVQFLVSGCRDSQCNECGQDTSSLSSLYARVTTPQQQSGITIHPPPSTATNFRTVYYSFGSASGTIYYALYGNPCTGNLEADALPTQCSAAAAVTTLTPTPAPRGSPIAAAAPFTFRPVVAPPVITNAPTLWPTTGAPTRRVDEDDDDDEEEEDGTSAPFLQPTPFPTVGNESQDDDDDASTTDPPTNESVDPKTTDRGIPTDTTNNNETPQNNGTVVVSAVAGGGSFFLVALGVVICCVCYHRPSARCHAKKQDSNSNNNKNDTSSDNDDDEYEDDYDGYLDRSNKKSTKEDDPDALFLLLPDAEDANDMSTLGGYTGGGTHESGNDNTASVDFLLPYDYERAVVGGEVAPSLDTMISVDDGSSLGQQYLGSSSNTASEANPNNNTRGARPPRQPTRSTQYQQQQQHPYHANNTSSTTMKSSSTATVQRHNNNNNTRKIRVAVPPGRVGMVVDGPRLLVQALRPDSILYQAGIRPREHCLVSIVSSSSSNNNNSCSCASPEQVTQWMMEHEHDTQRILVFAPTGGCHDDDEE